MVTPQPAVTAEMEVSYHYGQPTSGAKRAFGMFVTLLLVVGMGFFLFVLYQNDWSLDLANFGTMLDKAFGNDDPQRYVRDELRGLEVDKPIVGEAKLLDGLRVLTVEGVVRNTDTRTRRFIYVRAVLKDNYGRKVMKVEAPAGNVFSREQLSKLTKNKLASKLNPAGRDGRNAKLQAGQSVAYMVVITTVPPNYAPTKHTFSAEVSQAEILHGP